RAGAQVLAGAARARDRRRCRHRGRGGGGAAARTALDLADGRRTGRGTLGGALAGTADEYRAEELAGFDGTDRGGAPDVPQSPAAPGGGLTAPGAAASRALDHASGPVGRKPPPFPGSR